MSSLQKQVIKSKLPPLYSGGAGSSGRMLNRRRDYTPVSWDKYFDSYKDVQVSNNSFRVYLKGNNGPLLLLLHGGGYSGLSWSLFSASITQLVECQIAAIDLRGHGETHCYDDDDLSADTLASDIGDIVHALYSDKEEPPPIILTGHSMGGAIAVHAVFKNLVSTAIGLVVIDVVEGTAMDALQSMQSFLRSRPPSFSSLPTAIEWCVRSGQVRNVESAKVSMPGQLKNSTTNACATRELHLQNANATTNNEPTAPRQVAPPDSILEEDEEEHSNANSENEVINAQQSMKNNENEFRHPAVAISSKYVWRIDLGRTEKFWAGWFEGLSNMFLSTTVPKLLLLAGVDRLDKDLTIGQMQGKFQMQVLPQCGHAVHEDDPDKVSEAIATFLVRNKFATPLCDFQKPFPSC